jgi:hypothetical protein
LWEALHSAVRETQRQPGKAAAVTLTRLVLLLLALLNLHLFIQAGVWVAGNLGGLDTALLGVLLELDNPVYVLALMLLCWLLLTPYAEAANYLLHIDARARFEGLDLWYRVQRLFPIPHKSRAGAVLLAVGVGLLLATPARANPDRLTVVRGARAQIQKIIKEVEEAKPYPGSGRWLPRLREVGEDLERAAGPNPKRSPWFAQALAGFEHRGQQGALHVLEELDDRLALLEETLTPQGQESPARSLSNKEIKGLVKEESSSGRNEVGERPAPRPQQDPELKRPVKDDPKSDKAVRVRGRGPGMAAPQLGGGFSAAGWALLAGLLLAVLVVAGVLLWRNRSRRQPVKAPSRRSVAEAPSLEFALSLPQQSVAALWRQAEDLARQGDYREAVRILYLAVLVLLHRANRIRYEKMRTNGEYAQQLRSEAALYGPFQRLTTLFEVKWYGERACRPEDFEACRGLADHVREKVAG